MTEAAAKTALGEVCREITFGYSCPFDVSLKEWPDDKRDIADVAWKFHRRWANISNAKKNARIRPQTDDRHLDELESALRLQGICGITFADQLRNAHAAWKKARGKK